jgi:hypothetical protein
MKTCLALLVVAALINFIISDAIPDTDPKKVIYDLDDAPALFEKFIQDYGKNYEDDEEYDMRYNNFVNNLKFINEQNAAQSSYTLAINKFADLGKGEHPGMGYKPPKDC